MATAQYRTFIHPKLKFDLNFISIELNVSVGLVEGELNGGGRVY